MARSIVDNYTIPEKGDSNPQIKDYLGDGLLFALSQEEMECLWTMMYFHVKGMPNSVVESLYDSLGDRLGLDIDAPLNSAFDERVKELEKKYAQCL